MTASHTPDSAATSGAVPMFSVDARRLAPPVQQPTMPAPAAGSATAAAATPPLPAAVVEAPVVDATVLESAVVEAPVVEVVDARPAALPAPTTLTGAPLAAPTHAGLAVARAAEGLPMVLDPFAVASRAVLVLIGSIEPAKHIARTAIEMSIEHDSSAAIDVVIPRAIDLVLRRAAHLVSIGAGPKVVDHYTERLELWRRLARRRGLEPAAIVLTLAPFPIPTVASMLRVSVADVEACIDDWYAGIDPEDDRPRSIESADEVIDLRTRTTTAAAASAGPTATARVGDPSAPAPGATPAASAAPASGAARAARPSGKRPVWSRWLIRQA